MFPGPWADERGSVPGRWEALNCSDSAWQTQKLKEFSCGPETHSHVGVTFLFFYSLLSPPSGPKGTLDMAEVSVNVSKRMLATGGQAVSVSQVPAPESCSPLHSSPLAPAPAHHFSSSSFSFVHNLSHLGHALPWCSLSSWFLVPSLALLSLSPHPHPLMARSTRLVMFSADPSRCLWLHSHI